MCEENIPNLTLNDYSYIHKKLKFFSDAYKFKYLSACVKYILQEVSQTDANLLNKRDDYLFMLSCIDDVLPDCDEFNYCEIITNGKLILKLLGINETDEEYNDISFVNLQCDKMII